MEVFRLSGFYNKTKKIIFNNFWESVRFAFMGGIGVMSYFLFSNLYNYLEVPTYLSPFFAWLSGLVIVYFGHMKFTYRVQSQHRRMFVRFLVMQSYNLIMSTFSTVVVAEWLGWSYLVASLFALATTVPVLYIIGKYWVYRSV